MPAGTIIVADDHPLFRDALCQAIADLPDEYEIRKAGDFETVLGLLEADGFVDLVLLDLNMPGNNGFSGLLRIRTDFPAIPTAIVSATEDPATIGRALEIGASGYIPKSSNAESIREAIMAVLDGEIWLPENLELADGQRDSGSQVIERFRSLTPQQSRVLSMLGEGLLNKQIAYELGVSEATVKAHVSAVLTKLGVDSRTQAVILLGKFGLQMPGQGKQAAS